MGKKKKALPMSTNKDLEMMMPCTLEQSTKQNIELAQKLLEVRDFEDAMGSNQLYISNKVIQPLNYFIITKGKQRTADEYAIAFNAFLEIIDMVNEKMTYTPTKNTFCRFLGISKSRFNALMAENNDTGDICRQINDFLEETLMQNMLGNRVGAVQGIFIAKANLGMRDSESQNLNVVNINAEPQTLSDILENFKKTGH